MSTTRGSVEAHTPRRYPFEAVLSVDDLEPGLPSGAFLTSSRFARVSSLWRIVGYFVELDTFILPLAALRPNTLHKAGGGRS